MEDALALDWNNWYEDWTSDVLILVLMEDALAQQNCFII